MIFIEKKYLHIAALMVSFASVAYGESVKYDVNSGSSRTYERNNWSLKKPQVGVFAGMTNPEGNYSNSTEYGATLGYEAYSAINVVGELSSSHSNLDGSTTGVDLQRTKLIAYGLYNFDPSNSFVFKPYAGIGLGPMLESTTAQDRVVLATIPTLGFDYPFDIKNKSQVSLGINTRYLISSSSIPNAFGANIMAKYWF